MQNKNNKQRNNGRKVLSKAKGYTIIETMIAVALFLVVVMAGMGAILNANLLHQKSRDMRSIMDNLSFIMEDMGRNLRTGYNYRCYSAGEWNQSLAQTPALNIPQSCSCGEVIVFEEAHGLTPVSDPADPNATDQWAYKIESTDGGGTYNIFKSVTGGGTLSVPDWVPLNPIEVNINPNSGFSVLGAEPQNSDGSGDKQQPFVTIRMFGTITYKNVATPFALQTSVSQRLLDN